MAPPGNNLARTIITSMLPQLVESNTCEPPYCPWRAYWEPLVVEALTLRARRESVDLDCQTAVIVEAMDLLDGTQRRIEAMDRAAEMKARKDAAQAERKR